MINTYNKKQLLEQVKILQEEKAQIQKELEAAMVIIRDVLRRIEN